MDTTRRRRILDHSTTQPTTGLLSNVFSFVSREFESFLLNATARPETEPTSTAHTRRRRPRDTERHTSDDEVRYRIRTHRHRQRERRPDEPNHRRPKPRSKSSDARTPPHDRAQPTHIDDDPENDRERPASPATQPSSTFLVPPLPRLKKQPSMTMPGALFPRSPSLLPDGLGGVHYTPATPTPVQDTHPPHDDPDGIEAGPSIVPNAGVPPLLDDYVSPWRTRSVASVKDAVYRFNVTDGVEADFSLMLPSPHSSPTRSASKRSVDGASPHRPTSHSGPAVAPPSPRKGKARARDDDLEYIIGGGGGDDGVRAVERELDAAREEQREHERQLSGDQSRRASDERDRDKRHIRALEEEVRRLKEELSRSQARSSPPPSSGVPPAPPPPPPPPPFPLRIDTAPYTPTSMFASARASLRHAMTPVEAPINAPAQSKAKRTGQPTVNVPSEKMAAFLQEIKTAKLRKVRSGLNAMGGDGVAGPSGLSKSVSVATSSASTAAMRLSARELQRRRSLASLRVPIGSALAAPVPLSAMVAAKEAEVRAGRKRKADTLGVEEMSGPPKRRMTEISSQPSSSGSQETAASSSSGILSRLSLSLPAAPTNETDVTTPSLCSDNDRDENSIEDQVPSTPPGPRTTTTNEKAPKTVPPDEQIEVIDIDMEERSHTDPRAISPDSVPRRTSDLFKKRPPMSPIPIPTPRRPSAPARTKRGATPRPKSLPSMESDEEEGDEALSQPAPVPFVSLIPLPKPKSTKSKTKPTLAGKGRPRATPQQQNHRHSHSSGSGSSSQNKRKKGHKRRQTLDEELRSAEARSSDVDQCNDELDLVEDVFTATGTRNSRRGFLAHGGGGGAPVFMGVGYVEGAEESEDDGVVVGTRPRRPSKPTSQGSFIPRPKGKT